MAGRSGRAALESELRDAAKGLDVQQLAHRVRSSNPSLAAALDQVCGIKPTFVRRDDPEEDMFIRFSEGSAEGVSATKHDVSDFFEGIPYGVEVQTKSDKVVGISLYLQ